MATRYYFHEIDAGAGPTGTLNTTDTDYFPSVPADKNTPKSMTTTKGSSQTSVAGSYNNAGANRKTLARIWVGPALAASQAITAGQAISFGAGYTEGNSQQNLAFRWFAYFWRSGTGIVKDLYGPTSATEHSTSEVECVLSGTTKVGAYSTQLNDRLVVELWFDLPNTKSAAYTATCYYDGTDDTMVDNTVTSDAGAYVNLADTLANAPSTFNETVELPSSAGIGQTGPIGITGISSFSGSAGMSPVGLMSIPGNFSLEVDAVIASIRTVVLETTLSLDAQGEIETINNVGMGGSVSMGVDANISDGSQENFQAVLSLLADAVFSSIGGRDFSRSVDLSGEASIASVSMLVVQGALEMIASATVALISQTSISGQVDLGASAEISENVSVEMVQALVLQVAAAIAQDAEVISGGGNIYDEDVAFGVNVDQAQNAILNVAANLGLQAQAIDQFAGIIVMAALVFLLVDSSQDQSGGMAYDSTAAFAAAASMLQSVIREAHGQLSLSSDSSMTTQDGPNSYRGTLSLQADLSMGFSSQWIGSAILLLQSIASFITASVAADVVPSEAPERFFREDEEPDGTLVGKKHSRSILRRHDKPLVRRRGDN